MYAEANSSGIIKEMIEIATNKTYAENYAQKHNTDAKFGWYRYDTRFAVPVYDDVGALVRYNVFKSRILVRHAKDGKRYLYDILRTKKKRASRLSNSCTVEKLISLSKSYSKSIGQFCQDYFASLPHKK
jgi:hypothetical protein